MRDADRNNTIEAGSEVSDPSILPDVLRQIVDDLQPLLGPYQIAFYWWLFRSSFLHTGEPYVRVGQKRLANIVKSVRGQKVAISQSHVKETLEALEALGAIRKEGEPSREGTLYRVLTPSEIEACRNFRISRLNEVPAEIDAAEIDYYNVRENRLKVYERDHYICQYCRKQLTIHTATLDHVQSVVERGGNGLENLVTACLECNSRKNKRRVGDFLAEL